MIETNKIHCMDCLDGLRLIPSGSVDLVLTDPPYGISFQSNHRPNKFAAIENDSSPFIWWLYDANRVLKEGGSIVCFCRYDVQEAFRIALEWAGFKVKSQLIWVKNNWGMGDLKASFAPQHEVAWFATKGKGFEFKNGRPKSVLQFSRIDPSSMIHPTEKPVSMMSYLIEQLTVNGGIVLDPFMGSGATALACKQTGRSFYGFELSAKYAAVGNKRLSQKTLNDTSTEVLEAEALRAPPNPKGSGIRAGDLL